MYNTLSAVVAIIGMFIGVAVGHASEDATLWILAITAGVFLYVALVDLVCQLIASCCIRTYIVIIQPATQSYVLVLCCIISAPWVDGNP